MKRHNLTLWIAIFWLTSGVITLQMSLFIISIGTSEIWHDILYIISKSSHNFTIALVGIVLGTIQLLYGFIIIIKKNEI